MELAQFLELLDRVRGGLCRGSLLRRSLRRGRLLGGSLGVLLGPLVLLPAVYPPGDG